MSRPRVDLFAVLGAVVALTMAAAYVAIVRAQDDSPLVWFLTALVAAACGAAYGAVRSSPHRGAVLAVAALLLFAMGTLAILSIGPPILAAGALCLVAALRAQRTRSAGSSTTV